MWGWESGRKHNLGQTLEICAPLSLTCYVALCHSRHPPCFCLLSSSVVILPLDITISLGKGKIFCNASLNTNAITLWMRRNNSFQQYIGCGRSCFFSSPALQISSKRVQQKLVKPGTILCKDQYFFNLYSENYLCIGCLGAFFFFVQGFFCCLFVLLYSVKSWQFDYVGFAHAGLGLCTCVTT